MLGRAPLHVPALVNHAEVFLSAESSKRFCKAWPRGVLDLVVEPTSVLDLRSPSPSSTLSSSVATGSSESGRQGSITSGAVGLFPEEAQLPDCTSLLDGGKEVGSVWAVEREEDGKAEKEMVGTWLSGNSKAWEGSLGHASMEEETIRHDEARQSLIEGVISAGMSNVQSPHFTRIFNSPQEKQGPAMATIGQSSLAPACSSSGDGLLEKMVKCEVVADESLEACVMSCRKRDREDCLEEVVQRFGRRVATGDTGQKLETGEWLSDWNDFESNAAVLVGDKPVAADNLEDLDDIFSSSPPPPPPPPPPEFWMGDNLPSVQDVTKYDGSHRADNVGYGALQSASKVQLDLYEAVQAGMLGGGSSKVGGSAAVSDVDTRPVMSPAPVLPCSNSTPLSSPFHHLGRSLLPFQHHTFGSAAAPAMFAGPDSLDNKLTAPSPRSSVLLNATSHAPPPPQFSSPLQFQDLAFPLPSVKHPQLAQVQLYGYQTSEVSPKAVPCGPNWPVKQEPGWQLSSGHVRPPMMSPPLSLPAEQPQRRHPLVPPELHVGRRVRLDGLALVERHFSAVLEAARLGDFSSAQAILARLNQQQQNQTKGQQVPSQRVTSLFSEALANWVSARSQMPCEISSMDLITKISAFKSFCEVSPISQFAHFTANQAILEAMEGEDCVHLIDFELGFGGQWASFMQEISQRSRGPPELKITTMGVDSLEMRLAQENLYQFAKEMGMKLQINVLPVEKLDGVKAVMVKKGEREAVAVNFGFGLSRLMADFSSAEGVVGLLKVIKGMSPKVIAVVDSECEFEGTSLMEAVQYYSCIFESMEAAGKLPWEVRESIEKLVFGPKIRDVVNARRAVGAEGGLPPWRILLQKAGFSPLPFSAAAESQASWLVKNPLNSGFTFLKQHSTLFLGWCNKTLVSATSWV